jgi:hypothetical protein
MLATFGFGSAASASLVTNGGFESGDQDFASDLGSAAGFPGFQQYNVASSISLVASPFEGSLFMAVNGFDSVGTDETVWAQDVSVVENEIYDFSIAIADWSGFFPKALLSARADGVEFAQIAAPTTAGIWEVQTGSFTATTTGDISLSLVELSNGFGGNDYALDNISLVSQGPAVTPPAVPLPAGVWLLLAGLGGLVGLKRRGRI